MKEPKDLLRIATLNVLNNKDSFFERLEAALIEADNHNVDVFFLQEILTEHLEESKTLCTQYGYEYIISTLTQDNPNLSRKPNNNLIISKIPYNQKDLIIFPDIEIAYDIPVMKIQYNGYSIYFLSAHLVWGGERGHLRLQQVRIVSEYAKKVKTVDPSAIIVFGGDFNAEPEDDTIRYLKGRHTVEGYENSFWVDVTFQTEWEHIPTTRPHDEWGTQTARGVGIINPLKVPERKIDYLFINGWVYGRPGTPLNSTLFGTSLTKSGKQISDHYGLITDLWVPQN